jgi:hypothetical protein
MLSGGLLIRYNKPCGSVQYGHLLPTRETAAFPCEGVRCTHTDDIWMMVRVRMAYLMHLTALC